MTSHYMLLSDPKVDPRIDKLARYGYLRGVKKTDLPKLKVNKDSEVKAAVKLYQETFSHEMNHLTKEVHGRLAQPDGILGPATDLLLDMPRCGAPDFGVAQEARWPDSCKDRLSVSYFFDRIDENIAKKAWEVALGWWRNAIEMGFELRDQFSRDTHIWATDSSLSGSILAWSMLAQGSCAQNAEQRYNTRVNWTVIYLARTMAHELGHAFGMGHLNTRSALMYPSIQPHDGPQPPDIEYMVRLGYTKRTTPPPEPPPQPPTGGFWSGTIKNTEGTTVVLSGVQL